MSEFDFDKLVEKYDYDTKLDIAAWAVSKIHQHGENPGSFRHLIYGLMGFGPDAYVTMYYAGGLEITNEFDYSIKSNLKTIIQEEKIENTRLKRFAGLCNEPNCFDSASCGFPTDTGYRWTCFEHSDMNKPKNNG